MDGVNNFFGSWGFIKFDNSAPFKSAETKLWENIIYTGKNVIEYLPIVGLISAVWQAINFDTDKDIPSQAGSITHAVIGGLGGGLVCFTVDVIASLVRAVKSYRESRFGRRGVPAN
jgi:hypothetical protein